MGNFSTLPANGVTGLLGVLNSTASVLRGWGDFVNNPQHPIKLFEYKFDTIVDALNKTKTRRELNILFISIFSINTYLLIERKLKFKKSKIL